MIDFHTHILPNVDDGSKSVEETFNLIKEAKSVGFDSIISTSHYIEEYYEVGVEERKAWINGLSQALEKENIDVNLYLGNEVYFSENIMKLLKENRITTINNTDYILFEFPMNVKPMNIYDVVYEMLSNKLIPVLAHPERYSFVHKDPNLICELMETGVLMQCNYGSIIGQYGERAQIIAKKLFENNMVHFLGSDVHRQNSVYPNVPRALHEIEAIIGKEKLYEITTLNPGWALENKIIDVEDPKELKFSLKEKKILNKHK